LISALHLFIYAVYGDNNNNKLPLLQSSQTARLQQAVTQDSNEKSDMARV